LRIAIETLAKDNNWEFYLPAFQYCTDNAGMVAIAGFHKYHAGKFLSQSAVPLARMPIAIDQ